MPGWLGPALPKLSADVDQQEQDGPFPNEVEKTARAQFPIQVGASDRNGSQNQRNSGTDPHNMARSFHRSIHPPGLCHHSSMGQ